MTTITAPYRPHFRLDSNMDSEGNISMSEFLGSDREPKLASVATLLQQLREQRANEPAPSVAPKQNLDSEAARETRCQQIRTQLHQWKVSSEDGRQGVMVDDTVVVSIDRDGAAIPLSPLSPEFHTVEVFRVLETMRLEADFRDELVEELRDFPHLSWQQFLTMKLNEAKRARPMNFSTIRHLQNLLADA